MKVDEIKRQKTPFPRVDLTRNRFSLMILTSKRDIKRRNAKILQC